MFGAKSAAVIGCFALSLVATPAPASFIVQLASITADSNNLCSGGTNGFRWRYSATITTGEGLGGAFFTIYDLPGTICTVEAAGGWGAGSQNTGVTPSGQSPVDDPTIQNVTFTSSLNQPSNGQLFSFDIIFTAATPFFGVFSWQDQTSYPTGSTQSGTGIVGGASTVPEPATLALAGAGLALLGAMRRRGSRARG
jgi:hypothetical protein